MSRSKTLKEDLAIVGIGCRYPVSGVGAEAFWNMLCQGVDAVKDIPKERWNKERYCDPSGETPGTMRVKQGAFIDQNIEQFDAHFFGISPRDAECIDPQQRLLLEVVWEAFEDAGMAPSQQSGSNTGVYAGGFTIDYFIHQLGEHNRDSMTQYTALGSSLVMMSNRLSYIFNLLGPSFTIDTACSSSLVAFHYACQDLWHGKTDQAVVCGVNVMLKPEMTAIMSRGQFLSTDAHCKTFDATADGYGRGEGAGAVIIKPLSKAIADGDDIYSVVKATGVNQDGRTSGIASPNGDSQERLIRQVLSDSNLDEKDIVLIEAHGTGTAIGDTTEITALAKAFNAKDNDIKRFIGSVKANIGHQEAGAGVAGLIKTSLSLKHSKVAPQININNLNPKIPFDDYQFKIADSLQDLVADRSKRPAACVNSFGYGGTNAHAILQQYQNPDDTLKPQEFNDIDILTLSARSRDALIKVQDDYKSLLQTKTTSDISNLCYSAAKRRDHHNHRLAMVNDVNKSLIDIFEKNDPNHFFMSKEDDISSAQDLVWVFTGMGPQWWAMGQQLYQQLPVFKKAMDEAAHAFAEISGWSILDEMLKPDKESQMATNKIAQPANFILQAALIAQWTDWGLTPSAIIGHSVGEVGAALASGALDLNQAAQVAFHRSRLQQTKAGQGRLLAIGLDESSVQDICDIYSGDVSLAAINSHNSCAIAGSESVLNDIAKSLEEQGIFNRLVMGEVAYHSYQMDDLKDEVLDSLAKIHPKRPSIPLYSSVTGSIVNEPMHDADYWWKNVRQPVQFNRAVQQIYDDGYSSFLEVGPHPVLSAALLEIGNKKSIKPFIYSSMQRKADEKQHLYKTLAQLYVRGANINWDNVYSNRKYIRLPAYPWQRKQHWAETASSRRIRTDSMAHPFLGIRLESPLLSWQSIIPNQFYPQIVDHVIDGQAVFPASAYIEAMVAAAKIKHAGQTFSIESVKLLALLALPKGTHIQLKTVFMDERLLHIYSKPIGQDGSWVLHASAKIILTPYISDQLPSFDETIECHQKLTKEFVYQKLAVMGLNYQSAFQPMTSASLGENSAYAEMTLPISAQSINEFTLSPVLLDGCLQLLGLLALNKDPAVPVGIERLIFFKALPEQIKCQMFVIEKTDDQIKANIHVFDQNGELVAKLIGVSSKVLPTAANNESYKGQLHQWHWQEVDLQPLSIKPINSQKRQIWQAPKIQNDVLGLEACKALVQVVKNAAINNHQLIVITQSSQHIRSEDNVEPRFASIWGTARVARSEYPDLAITLLDCIDAQNISIDVHQLPEFGEFGLRDNQLYEHKLSQQDSLLPIKVALKDDFSYVLDVAKKGLLSSLNYRLERRIKPSESEIEVRINYASINFKDTLKALGTLDEDVVKNTYFCDSIGMESVGIVERVGSKVEEFQPGDLVLCCVATGGFKTFVTFDPTKMPTLKWQTIFQEHEIVGMPISFMTAELALDKNARLSKGETVLLHSASGGVGQAAIQVAQRLGAKIIATASTEEKRNLIKAMGVDIVFDSRSLNFADNVMQVTHGKGVDVALNFLSGDALNATLSVMAPFGRMVEIGKSDISDNNGLPLAAFQENLQFSSLDIDRYVKQRFEEFMVILRKVRDYYDMGLYKPVKSHIVPIQDTEKAFRKMLEANHLGKMSLEIKPQKDVKFDVGSERFDITKKLKTDAAYVITGGFGGLGLRFAQWLADHGASHIILAGRSGSKDEASKHIIKRLVQKGIVITEAKADVSQEKDVIKLLKGWDNESTLVQGIIHCAGILRDNTLDNVSDEDFDEVFAAKAQSAWLLHVNSIKLKLNLDFFVLCSSVSAVIGNIGQANYAAANTFLDGLATHRREQGLPALSINLGAVSEVGMAANNKQLESIMTGMGLLQSHSDQILDSIELALKEGTENYGVFNLDWSLWSQRNSYAINVGAFEELIKQSQRGDNKQYSNVIDFSSLSEEEGLEKINEFIQKQLIQVLRIDKNDINASDSFALMGMDSLMSVEFTLGIQDQFNLTLGPTDVSPSMNSQQLTQLLYNKLTLDLASSQKQTDQTDKERIDIDSMSDEEVNAMLEELAQIDD